MRTWVTQRIGDASFLEQAQKLRLALGLKSTGIVFFFGGELFLSFPPASAAVRRVTQQRFYSLVRYSF